jgi:4-hydroxybenzoate polyprenyltransferase
MQTLRRFLEMIRFSHTLFALPFALFSAALAWYGKQAFSILELVGILLCMVFARSAAMAFNRLADRDVDALNPRTAVRHLPSGQLSVVSVWLFTLVCCAGFIASTAIFLIQDNPWPIYLAVPVLLFLLGYSLTKRFTALAHFWLGASLLLAPMAAWIAIRAFDEWPTPLVIGLAVLFWVAGFDIIYACQDADFDRQAKLHSIPALFGVPAALQIAKWSHAFMVAMLVVLYLLACEPYGPLGRTYLVGLGGVTALLVYEHALVRPDDLTRVNQAFFQVNIIISVGLLAVLMIELARVYFL